MAGGQEKWYFTKEQLQNSPSRKCGLDADKELAYRQQAANLIQDMGQRLQVSQLCINTAIVYMHRFYAFHSFTQFHRNAIAAAALFLAAKVEEQPRKLEYVIKVAHVCLHRGEGVNALTSEQYQEQAQDLVFNENVLLQTLGFDVAIDHPHTHVVRTCHLVKAPKDLAQTSYFMASNSLHLTTMCLQYRPTVVACFCIHLASKWSNWASNEGRHWFSYVDRSVTAELLEKLTAEFLHIFDKCPSRLKRKMMTMSNSGSSPAAAHGHSSAVASPFDKKHPTEEFDKSAFDKEYERERRRAPQPGGYIPAPTAPPTKIDYTLYREKREREERERRDERERRQLARPDVRPDVRPDARPEVRPDTRPDVRPDVRPEAIRPDVRAAPAPRPGSSLPPPPAPPHGPPHGPPHAPPRASQSQSHHHKPHHTWPHHKPPHHKTQHDHRHHRPPAGSQPPAPAAAPPAAPPEPPAARTRPPSLFSPENVTTPQAAAAAPRKQHLHRHKDVKTEIKQERMERPVEIKQERPPSPKKRPDPSTAIRDMQPPAILSPFSSPPVIKIEQKPRQRAQSNSEPELVPVMKKLDEMPGYENVIRDSQRGNAIKADPSKVKIEKREIKTEPVHVQRPLNGIETDPTLVSNLLKESLAKPAPITVATERKSPIEVKKEPAIEPQPVTEQQQEEKAPEHKHKKEKKKKEKHKHKDRDKSKEERKKHKKDKEREKKEQSETQAEDGIRITIPREKLSSPGLRIKIPKERLAAPPPPPQGSGLKIKISKDLLDTSRKRTAANEPGPPHKMARHNGASHKVIEHPMGNGHGK